MTVSHDTVVALSISSYLLVGLISGITTVRVEGRSRHKKGYSQYSLGEKFKETVLITLAWPLLLFAVAIYGTGVGVYWAWERLPEIIHPVKWFYLLVTPAVVRKEAPNECVDD